MLRSKYLIYFAFISSLFAKEIIAVLDLEQIGLTPQEATILTQRLTTELIFLDKYQVVERNNMDKILKEQKFQHSGCTDSECAVEIGQLLNSDYIIIGSVNKFGKTYAIDARLIDVGLGKGKLSAKFSMTGEIDALLTTGINSIAKQLCGMQAATTLMQTPTQQSTPTATSGFGATLDIKSEPPGAEIYIGGNSFGITPIILTDFPAGDYEVKFKLAGYEGYTKSVKLLPRGSQNINASLNIIHSWIVFVGSTPAPSDVSIEINGIKKNIRYAGFKIEVIAGTHTIRVSKENYLDHVDTVTVAIGETARISYELKKNIGLLQLSVNPSDAEIYVDDNVKSKYTELTPGMHALKVSQPGYDDYTGEFEIKLDETTELDIELNRQYGHLDLKLEPYNAKVFFNDTLALSFNMTSSIELGNNTLKFELATGTYNVRAEKPSFYTKSMMATINNKERTELMLSLINGDEDLKKLRKNRKLGYMATGIIATAFAAEYFLGKSSYKSYKNATTATDAQKYRNQNEMFTTLKTPTAALLGASAGFTLYTTISLESLKTKLSLK
jgi:TolB-like protein